MNEKRSAVFTIAVIAAIILIFTAADLIQGDRVFSEAENKVLASRPKFTVEALFQGKYTEDYETYVTDQFVSREKWIAIKTYTDMALGRQEINGVYLGEDGYLIEQHFPEDYPQESAEEKLELLRKLKERWNAKVMLVPAADNILQDKLPANAPCYDETWLLNRAAEVMGDNYIDVYGVLQEHGGEQIYYRTDHHWTSLGAYYGYLAWAEDWEKEWEEEQAEKEARREEKQSAQGTERFRETAGGSLEERFPSAAEWKQETGFPWGQEENGEAGESGGGLLGRQEENQDVGESGGELLGQQEENGSRESPGAKQRARWSDVWDGWVERFDKEDLVTVTEDFLGTLHSKVNIEVNPDTIQCFPEEPNRPVKVTYDLRKTADTCYEQSYLDTKNKYGFFLDDNHAVVEIETDYHNGKTLFVLKDSYANCFVPMLIPYYEKIYIMDLRYFNGRLFRYMESCEPEEGMDVLVLYNCIHFLENFMFLE